jgi:hypothetical protein
VVKEITRKELKAKIDRRDDFYLVEALARWHYQRACGSQGQNAGRPCACRRSGRTRCSVSRTLLRSAVRTMSP